MKFIYCILLMLLVVAFNNVGYASPDVTTEKAEQPDIGEKQNITFQFGTEKKADADTIPKTRWKHLKTMRVDTGKISIDTNIIFAEYLPTKTNLSITDFSVTLGLIYRRPPEKERRKNRFCGMDWGPKEKPYIKDSLFCREHCKKWVRCKNLNSFS